MIPSQDPCPPMARHLRRAALAKRARILVALVWLVAGCDSSPEKSAQMEEAAAQTSVLVGQPAPGFKLMAHHEQEVSLKDYKGQWLVLYFYPRDDTPGCTCQATEFTRLLSDFNQLNSTVLGVSPDSPYSHRRFRDKYDIRITLLSDPDHEVARRYGAWSQMGWGERRVGRIVRGTVIINPQGVIAYHWPEVLPLGHARRVHDTLAQLRAASS